MMIQRTIGLAAIVVLTMGSGGVKRSSDDATRSVIVANQPEVGTVMSPSDVGVEQAVEPAKSHGDDAMVATDAGSEFMGNGSAIELALSTDYLQGRYFSGPGLLGFDQANGNIGLYFSTDRDLIGDIGVMSDPFSVLTEGLTLTFGARGYLALLADPSTDVFGIAPGVEARYAIPTSRPMAAVGSFFYSPDILTFGDAKDIVDLDIRYEVQVIPSTVGFVGYRLFSFDSDVGDDKDAANEIQLGARYAF
ncbi:MAG: YfaZ family outer membrane protein [Geminicoccaceae bacterium]